MWGDEDGEDGAELKRMESGEEEGYLVEVQGKCGVGGLFEKIGRGVKQQPSVESCSDSKPPIPIRWASGFS